MPPRESRLEHWVALDEATAGVDEVEDCKATAGVDEVAHRGTTLYRTLPFPEHYSVPTGSDSRNSLNP